jgi:hypothetical protein
MALEIRHEPGYSFFHAECADDRLPHQFSRFTFQDALAIEFAMIVPIMAVMFIGGAVAAMNRR